jgi:hypothetical protein
LENDNAGWRVSVFDVAVSACAVSDMSEVVGIAEVSGVMNDSVVDTWIGGMEGMTAAGHEGGFERHWLQIADVDKKSMLGLTCLRLSPPKGCGSIVGTGGHQQYL